MSSGRFSTRRFYVTKKKEDRRRVGTRGTGSMEGFCRCFVKDGTSRVVPEGYQFLEGTWRNTWFLSGLRSEL